GGALVLGRAWGGGMVCGAAPGTVCVGLVRGVPVGWGAIGCGDDYLNLPRRNSKGLPGYVKLIGELVIAAIAALVFIKAAPVPLDNTLAVPFLKDVLVPLGWFFLPVPIPVHARAS